MIIGYGVIGPQMDPLIEMSHNTETGHGGGGFFDRLPAAGHYTGFEIEFHIHTS